MEQQAIFLSGSQVVAIAKQHGTPLYVYSRQLLKEYALKSLAFKGPYGTTVRYAVKANPHKEIVLLFDSMGLHFDLSSGGEVELLLNQGIDPKKLTLNSQELPKNLGELVGRGVHFTATSLHQLEVFGRLKPGGSLGIRLNPGIGSGENNKVLTGGITAGFGIWHEYIPEILKIAKKYDLHFDLVHTHIGVGTDPAVWERVAAVTLDLSNQFPEVERISLGGGFKVGRMDTEPTVDVPAVGKRVADLLTNHALKTGRKMHVEIEPGTFLTAMAGVLVANIIDITDTGNNGYTFIKLNTGMNDFLRPILYGAQHPMWVIGKNGELANSVAEYVVIGHNCESGDLLTPMRDQPDVLGPRLLPTASIGDYLVIGGAGAYCASLRAIGYNSFSEAKEILL